MKYRSGTDRLISAAVIAVVLLTFLLCILLAVRSRIYVPEADTGVPFAQEENSAGTANYVRTKEKYNFLVLGVDRAAGLADTIMVVSMSTSGDISIVQIPRDTYVNYLGRDAKINSVYLQSGAEALRSLIGASLCINVDYTMIIGTEAFRNAVDAIGGVEVDVPADMDYEDPYQDLYIHIKAGRQLLDGSSAEGFVRYRSGYSGGDLDRIDAQKIFIKALIEKLRDDIGLSDALRIAESVLPSLDTDISSGDCLWFLRILLSEGLSGSEKLTMLTFPGKAVYSDELKQSFYVIGREAAIQTVNTYLNVYDSDITDEVFDSGRIFVRADDEDFERIYKYAIITPSPVTGDA